MTKKGRTCRVLSLEHVESLPAAVVDAGPEAPWNLEGAEQLRRSKGFTFILCMYLTLHGRTGHRFRSIGVLHVRLQ
jgi:hypothetical protein